MQPEHNYFKSIWVRDPKLLEQARKINQEEDFEKYQTLDDAVLLQVGRDHPVGLYVYKIENTGNKFRVVYRGLDYKNEVYYPGSSVVKASRLQGRHPKIELDKEQLQNIEDYDEI